MVEISAEILNQEQFGIIFPGQWFSVRYTGICGLLGLISCIMPQLNAARCRKISRVSLARSTIQAQASNISVGPGDYENMDKKDGHNGFESIPDTENSSKVWVPID